MDSLIPIEPPSPINLSALSNIQSITVRTHDVEATVAAWQHGYPYPQLDIRHDSMWLSSTTWAAKFRQITVGRSAPSEGLPSDTWDFHFRIVARGWMDVFKRLPREEGAWSIPRRWRCWFTRFYGVLKKAHDRLWVAFIQCTGSFCVVNTSTYIENALNSSLRLDQIRHEIEAVSIRLQVNIFCPLRPPHATWPLRDCPQQPVIRCNTYYTDFCWWIRCGQCHQLITMSHYRRIMQSVV